MRSGGGCAVRRGPTKEMVSMRLDADLIAALRASGAGWQSRVNSILRHEVLDAT